MSRYRERFRSLTGDETPLEILGKPGSAGAGGVVAIKGGAGDGAGAGGAASVTGGTAGATSGAGGAASLAGGAGTATGAAGGAVSATAAAGVAGATTTAGGAGGAASVTAGAGGAKSGTGAAAGGVGGAASLVAGAGGATASSGTDAGGAGGDIAITAGAGGAASAGTGNGGAGGSITLAPGAGGSSAGGTAGAAGLVIIGGTNPVPVAFNLLRSTISGGATISDAQLRGGVLYQDASSGSVTMTTRTGTQIAAAFPDLAIGNALVIRCASNHASNTSTISGGTDVTLVGSGAITQTGGTFLLIKTGATTFDLVRVG